MRIHASSQGLLCLLATVPAAAQQLTVHEAVERALGRHPLAAEAVAARDRAETVVTEARAAWLPLVLGEGTATRFEEPMVVAPIHGFTPGSLPEFDETLVQGAVSLSYTLFDGGARGARIRRAHATVAAAEASLEVARGAVIMGVVRAYLRLGSAREVAAAQRRQIDAIAAERDRAARLVAEGRAARVSLLRAEAALSRARADAVAADAELRLAAADLARWIGADAAAVQDSELAPVALSDTARADPAALHARALAASPEVLRVRAQAEGAAAGHREARSLWLPKLGVAARYVEYGSGRGDFQGEWQGGFQLSYPLFTGGTRGAASERADAEERAARAQVRLAELRVAEAVDHAAAAVDAARARAAALADAASQFEEVARIERLALDAGAGVQTDYLAAEAELFRARAAHTEARHAVLAARVEQARVTGELGPDWIAAHLESVR